MTPKFVRGPQRGQPVVVPTAFQEKAVPQPEFPPVPVAQPMAPFGAMIPPLREGDGEALVRTELPGPQRLFLRQSEEEFFERVFKDLKKQTGSNQSFFRPEEPIISKDVYQYRHFQHMALLVEPNYVCHRRLYFEQPNFERTGWSLGVLQPAIHLGVFYYDIAMLPYHHWTDLSDRGECSVGKCLPGDQAPLLLYCERYSVTGLVGEAAVLSGLFYLFPAR